MTTQERRPHGRAFQINAFLQDRNSHITAFGKHKRVLLFWDGDLQQLSARVDAVVGDEDLPWPTPDQVMAVVFNPCHRLHPMGTTPVVITANHRASSDPDASFGQTEPSRHWLFAIEEAEAVAIGG